MGSVKVTDTVNSELSDPISSIIKPDTSFSYQPINRLSIYVMYNELQTDSKFRKEKAFEFYLD